MMQDISTLSRDDLVRHLQSTALRQWTGNVVLRVSGRESLDLLHRISTNSLLEARKGETIGTCLLTDKGRLVDRVHVLVGTSDPLLLVSPGNSARVATWIEKFIIMEEVRIIDCADELTGFSVVGPHAGDAINQAFGVLPEPRHHASVSLNGGSLIVSHPGQRESDRFDVIVPREKSDVIRPFQNALPVLDEGIAEVLRIWKGIPAFPGEISESFNPYEAGLSEFLNDRKGCYVGQEIVARLATYDKVQRGLTGVLLSGHLAEGTELFSGGNPIGTLTSLATYSVAGWHPGLSIVRKTMLQPGLPVVAGSSHRGFLFPLPFSVDAVPEASGDRQWMDS